jgi:polysaccharide export outer membrane protein
MALGLILPAFGQEKVNTKQDTPATTPPPGYVIGAGDVLQINVWKEPDASVPQVVVQLDGTISLPMVRDIKVGGLTPVQLEDQLKKQYERFFRDPEVAVVVKEINSQKIYMIGAVRKEGPIVLKTPLNVLQAISESGGLTDYAKRSKIYILRSEGGRKMRIPFDYQAAIRGEQEEANPTLRPGDTVVIPQ